MSEISAHDSRHVHWIGAFSLVTTIENLLNLKYTGTDKMVCDI